MRFDGFASLVKRDAALVARGGRAGGGGGGAAAGAGPDGGPDGALSRETLEALDEDELLRREDEDFVFLAANAKERARAFARAYAGAVL